MLERTLLASRLINKWEVEQYELLIGLLQQPCVKNNIFSIFHKFACHLYWPFN